MPTCQAFSPKAFKRSEEHTSELQSRPHLVCRLLLENNLCRQPRSTLIPYTTLFRSKEPESWFRCQRQGREFWAGWVDLPSFCQKPRCITHHCIFFGILSALDNAYLPSFLTQGLQEIGRAHV